MKKIYIYLIGFFILSPFTLQAQDIIQKLWPDGIPGAKTDTSYHENYVNSTDGNIRVAKVTEPEILVYLPKNPDHKKLPAIIICPGGGYSILAIQKEGTEIATWLNSLGIVGIILKYRLPSDRIMTDKNTGPLQDAQKAILLTRKQSEKWSINPNEVGIMGFSAGGHLASTLSTHYNKKTFDFKEDISLRPDFSILMYPVISMDSAITHMGSRNNLLGKNPAEDLVKLYSNDEQVTDDTPPAFIALAADDRVVPPDNSIRYFRAMVKHHVEVEMHIYEQGGHGFGLAKAQKGTVSTWPAACERWLAVKGLIQ